MSGVTPIHNDPLLSTPTDRCRCMNCGHYFRSSGTFARHRVGNWEQDGANRRCLTIEQMLAKGWLQDDVGYWIRSKMPTSAAASRRQAEIDTSEA